jgi:hypothetical protein
MVALDAALALVAAVALAVASEAGGGLLASEAACGEIVTVSFGRLFTDAFAGVDVAELTVAVWLAFAAEFIFPSGVLAADEPAAG